ncbi:LysE family translocator [Vogesella sp. LIG4]|uniref:LysE family translocator n=1 Tax=Vogesella sp. LIG4 TaxID=1192162 RepID=UPI00081FAC98|nr:LysE family transporter [Vogesella sp. LIG4]SCK15567.1 Threonine/homoserine/homoserine lactone efflux protein [Vogesella sp. LIG4]
MSFSNWILYLGTIVMLMAAPGPGPLLTLSHGAQHGARGGIPNALGFSAGALLLMALSALGITALLFTSPTAFKVVKLLGAGYLVWLGITLWRKPFKLDGAADGGPASRLWSGFRPAFLLAVSNPEDTIFFSALLPRFLDPSHSLWPQYLVMAATWVVADLVIAVLLAAAGGRLGEWLAHGQRLKRFSRTSGGLFMIAGLMLAAVQR